ncbi:MAG: hypothetical protein LCH95_22910 [Proteobacteria bacterium]|nr:hypothetical protein [Pseudomonadota bacterium]
MHRRTLITALAVLPAVPALAQAETRRVRGTVEKADGPKLFVKTRDGEDLVLVAPMGVPFVAVVPATLADLKPGTYVGSGALPQPDGSLEAIEVHIFPEAMRGTGEGHRPWDGAQQATMTNASIDTAVSAVDGSTLTLKYKDGEKTLKVTPRTAIVTYATGDRAEVTAGTKLVVTSATKQPDGSWQAARVAYGRNGLTPPM